MNSWEYVESVTSGLWNMTQDKAELLLSVILGTPWLVWPLHLPSPLSSAPSSFASFFLLSFPTSCSCPSAHVKHLAHFLVRGPPRASSLLPSSLPLLHLVFLPQEGLLHHLLLNSSLPCFSTGGLLAMVLFGCFTQVKWGLGATWGSGGGGSRPMFASTGRILTWLWRLNTYNKQIS